MIDVLNRLRRFDADTYNVDELIALYAGGLQLERAYGTTGLVVPEWVIEANRMLKQTIESKRIDQLRRESRLLDAELAKLEPKQEKRDRLLAKRLQLDATLGLVPKDPAPSRVETGTVDPPVPVGAISVE